MRRKTAVEVFVCDICGGDSGLGNIGGVCLVCGAEFCQQCRTSVSGCYEWSKARICEECGRRMDVMEIVRGAAFNVAELVRKRDDALKKLDERETKEIG